MLGPMPMDDQAAPVPGSAASPVPGSAASTAALAGRDYGEVLWEPTPEAISSARVTGYAGWLFARHGLDLRSHDQPWRWSVAEPAAFWESVWEYFAVLGDRGTGPPLSEGTMPGVRWFEGATLNYARNALACPRRSGANRRDLPERGRQRRHAHLRGAGARGSQGSSRAARAGRGDRRPGRRVHPERAGSADRDAGDSEPGRDLVIVLTGLRRQQRDRPVRADLAEGPDRCRWLHLRRQGLRPAGRGREHRGRAARPGRRRAGPRPGNGRPATPVRRRRREHSGREPAHARLG